MAASSRVWMTRFRKVSASPKYLNGSACSARPGRSAKFVTLPRAITRWSYSSSQGRVPRPAAVRMRLRWMSIFSIGRVVLSVHQRDLDRRTSKVTPENPLHGQRRVDSTEAAPQDEDPCRSWTHGHVFA